MTFRPATMKKIFLRIIETVSIILLVASCAKETPIINEVVQEAQDGETFVMRISTPNAATRTVIAENGDNYEVKWQNGDKLGVFEVADGVPQSKSESAALELADPSLSATFTFSLSGPAASSFDYSFVYPAAALDKNNGDPAKYRICLNKNQVFRVNSFDPAADILLSEHVHVAARPSSRTLNFARIGATARMVIKAPSTSETIQRITFSTTEGNLSGYYELNPGDGTLENNDNIYSGNKELVLTPAATTPWSGNIVVWFRCSAITLTDNFTVTVRTNVKTYTKTVNLAGTPRTLELAQGKLTKFNVNMTEVSGVVNTTLDDGDYVILAKNGSNYYALKAEKDPEKERLISVDYDGSLSSYSGDADIIWTITASDDKYTIVNDSKYLGYKGSDNESYWLASSGEWTTDNYLLNIEKSGDVWNIKHGSDRYLSRNTTNAFFAFYGNTGQYEEIVFVPATVDNRTPVTLSFAYAEINKNTSNYNGFTGQVASASPNVSAITSNISYAMTGDAIGTINSTSGAIALNGTIGSATVTASFAGDENYRVAQASYTINVANANLLPLSFSFTSSVAGWPANSGAAAEGSYTYRLSETDYTFTHTKAGNGIYCGGSYLMICADNYLGLPAIDGYKLVSVSATLNPSGTPSTASQGTITSDTSGTLVSGGSTQTFDTKGGSKTFTLSETEENTVYYLGISNKNFQCTQIDLVYQVVVTLPSPGMSWSAASATATYDTGNVLSFSAPTLTPGNATGITYASTDETIATINSSGVVSITALSGNNVKEGSTTIKAIFAGDESYKAQTVSYTLTVADNRTQVATPTFSPAAGTYSSTQNVTISCATDGATIHYTTDGTTPTDESPSYTDAISVSATQTIKAIATKTGLASSEVASASYTISNGDPEPVVLIIDGSKLTSTATTESVTKTYDGVDVVFSDGAKYQSSSGDNKFTNKAILIGKSGKNIHATVPGTITKFEIYANKGASTKVSVGINFSSSAIASYNASAANTYKATLSTEDHVYDCSASLPADANSFWYQVTNANNSQVEFRITYTPSN